MAEWEGEGGGQWNALSGAKWQWPVG